MEPESEVRTYMATTSTNTRSEQARINGAKSKGPITADGKSKSSKNALKHGFAAKVNVLIAPDDSEEWDIHTAGYRDSYLPVNYQETDFVNQLASISWRQSRLVGIETALIDFQLSVQEQKVDEYFPLVEGNPYLHLALAWQGLARKAYPRWLPPDPSVPVDPTVPPDGLDIDSIELVRRYQVSLDRQFRNALLNFRQYRKDFAPASAAAIKKDEAQNEAQTAAPNEPKPTAAAAAAAENAREPNEPNASRPAHPEIVKMPNEPNTTTAPHAKDERPPNNFTTEKAA
jgi:hypothetical protein